MPFQKGQSGNPGGRPKASTSAVELRDSILKATNNGEDLVKKLLDLMNFAPEPKDKLLAVKLLMEYSVGKPIQPVEHSGEIGAGAPALVFTKVAS